MTTYGRLHVWTSICAGFVVLAACNTAPAGENRGRTEDAGGTSTRPATATRPATESQPAATTTQPAVTTRPAPDAPIIRLGDAAAVTQKDFDVELKGKSPKDPVTALAQISRALVNRKLMELYVKDHPEFVTTEEIDQAVSDYMEEHGVKTLEEFDERLQELGYSLEYFRWRKMEELAAVKFNIEGTDLAEDEDLLKKMWEEDRTDWDGTRVAARHILLAFPAFVTPQEKQDIRKKAEKIRADLVTGQRTWEQCLPISDCRTRLSGGRLGSFRRHLDLNYGDKLAGVAFGLKKDEFSKVVETDWGFHILQVTDRRPGGYTYDQAKVFMKLWLRMQPKVKVMKELYEKYPVTGVQWPAPPPRVETSAQVRKDDPPKPRAARRHRARTQPAGSPATRPASVRRP